MVLPIMISGMVGQLGLSGIIGVDSGRGEAALSATLRAHSTTCLSGEDCVSVCGEPCGVKVGDTASSSILVACSTLCSRERDEVDSIVDKLLRYHARTAAMCSFFLSCFTIPSPRCLPSPCMTPEDDM